ncbi:hypothetical protein GGF46_002634 [Coemansia sp. RSA 552]|nr:hypothetical protein GGF46_002634 [Coemansia sp. RSA 552]
MPGDTHTSNSDSAERAQHHVDPFSALMADPFSVPRLLFGDASMLGSVLHFGWPTSEPPYARLLRRLGLFDPIELPQERTAKRRQSTFPVVVRSADVSQPQHRDGAVAGRVLPGLAEDSNSGRIIGPLSDVFGETTRWAVGSLFGHLRDVMDHVETHVHRDSDEHSADAKQEPQSFYRALRNDLVANFDRVFPESSGSDSRSYSYRVTTRTLPDGSIETRKTTCEDNGPEKTTVTRHYPKDSGDGCSSNSGAVIEAGSSAAEDEN